ncbi:MAG: DUF4241 domain-containing protein [Candidatus Obscuribacterales bacterium]|nr:DUF4241 domain-containing protein [Candidatus Obscuribacterales bacterium]
MVFNWLFGNKQRDAQFAQWVEAGAKQSHPGLLAALNGPTVPLGILSVPSGKMVIQDPADQLLDPCFDELVPSGNYPVDAVVVNNQGDQRIAALRVTVTDGEIDHFEPAWTELWRGLTIKRKELPWISVDSATVGLFSFESLLAYLSANPDELDAGPNADYLSGKPNDLFKETKFADGSNMFLATSGYGDGGYQCYWAKTADRKQVALIADFGLLGKPDRIDFN